jgi:hypothetical protein
MMRLIPIVAIAVALPGCAAVTARQSVGRTPAEALSGPASQQSGQGNVSAQLDASGWKGIEYTYTTAVPIGQVLLMILMLWFSHIREMARIRRNGEKREQ